MSVFIKMRHWQLFITTWGLPIAMNFFTIGSPQLLGTLFPYIIVVYAVGTFGWIWSMAVCLHEKLPPGVELNLSLFKVMFFFPILYITALLVWMSTSSLGDEPSGSLIAVIVCMHLLAMACIFLCMRFAAKTVKSIEIGRAAKVGDYIGEFILIWFMFLGVWFIQPRVNKLAETKNP